METGKSSWQEHRGFGRAAFRRRDFDEAEGHFLAALGEAEKLGRNSEQVADSLVDLAELYNRQSRIPKAERTHLRLLRLLQKRLGPRHPDLVPTLHALARAYERLGRYRQAESLHLRALSIMEDKHGSDSPEIVWSLGALALHYWPRRQYDRAEPHWKRAIAILERQSEQPSDAPGLNVPLGCLSMNYGFQGRHAEHENNLRRELALAVGREEDDLMMGSLYEKLADACCAQGKHTEGDSLYREAHARYEKWFASSLNARRFRRPSTATTRASLQASQSECRGRLFHKNAAAARQLDRPESAAKMEARAESLLRRALSHREKRERKDDLGAFALLDTLAEVLVSRDKFAEAEPLFKRLIAIEQNFWKEKLVQLGGPRYARARTPIEARLEEHLSPLLQRYAVVLRALGRERAAAELESSGEF